MITVLHPTRQRPDKSYHTMSKWYERAKNKNIEFIVSLDYDDPCLGAYEMNIHETSFMRAIVSENRSAVDAINKAAKEATHDIFIVVSDDTDCPEDWDEKILEVVNGKTDWILKCNDGSIQDWIITMPVMDREFYNRFGYIYYPEYKHMFVDTDLSAVADLTQRVIKCDIVFKHNHYSVGGMQKDSLSERADATWSQGEKLFIERVKSNFGLQNPPGKITSPAYLNWIASKL